ncbi:DUF3060 domain-containing protein [Nocardioides sp.]|uniref:DUF3060 domain-containing protein n=1 Tax=Nocardioides sp. TaxID=35761 RepID=UPI0035B38876
MTVAHRALFSLFLTLAVGAAAAVAAPAHAAGITVPVQCELGSETLLPWDGVTYDLQGTCGAVRVTADDATVTMPAATQLTIEGVGNTVTAKPLGAVSVVGAGTSLTTPSIQDLALAGSGSTVSVAGLVERAELTGTASTLAADTVNVLRLRGSDHVTARKAFRTRITGSDNLLGLTRAVRLVVTGDRNAVTVAKGRTTVRDRGEGNVLDLRPRRRG